MNYAALFRATLPETALEIAALLVIVVDLGFLRKAALQTRVAVAAFLGVAGCVAAHLGGLAAGWAGFSAGAIVLLAAGGSAGVAQVAILVLTALTLLLLIDSDFTRHAGEYVSVVLMAAAGGLIISAAQDLLVIFVGLELLSLGLYILTAFAKQSGKSAEAAIKYYLFGGMSAAFLLFGFSYLYGLSGSTSLPRVVLGTYMASAHGGAPLLIIALVMIAAGLGFKVAAVPFHLWAPDTYEGAPAPAAAFIASVSKVASFALLISISTRDPAFLGDASPERPHVTFSCASCRRTAPRVTLGIRLRLAADPDGSLRRLDGLRQPGRAGADRASAACLPTPPSRTPATFCSASRSSPGPNRERAGHPLLHPHLRPHHHRRIRRGRRRRARHRLATSSTPSSACTSATRSSPPCCSCSFSRSPEFRRWSASGPSSISLPPCSTGLRQRPLISLPADLALVALAIAFSAVSLYYYLQVLKRAYVMPATDESPIRRIPSRWCAARHRRRGLVLGCFPALLQNWIASFYPAM